ncbi:MAG TPA: AMP-binding protein [Acidobacteriota bacterium]|nr:AMP-binding protein [Acidobacteriota bacterium]
MEKIWLRQYQEGVPPEVDLSEYRSLKELLEKSCIRFGSLPAFTNMGTSITYRELDRLALQFAAYLQKELKLDKGTRVAIMMPNLLQYPVALFGVLRAGMTVVNINPLYTPRELRHQLQDSGAEVILVLENFAHTLEEALTGTAVRTVITTQVGDVLPRMKSCLVNFVVRRVKRMIPKWRIEGARRFRKVLQLGARQVLEDIALGPEDTAFLQYTGGTTGLARGAILTHGNVVANVLQTSAWIAGKLKKGAETVVTPLPLYHIFSLTVNCMTFVREGANNVLITNPRDIPGFVKELKRTRFSVITGVNTLYKALLENPELKEVDTSRLKFAVSGGMAVQRSVAQRWQETMGVPLIEGYGMTETSPVVSINPLNAVEFSGNIGLPIPSTEVSIRDEDDRELSTGQMGEICVRGPQVMKGYWNMPDETDRVVSRDGWFRTGDMGVIDEHGFVRLTDRKKDLVLVSGFKVYPNEVEDVLGMHDGVLECAVIGVPDEHSGEAVKAFVVRKDPNLTTEDLSAHCRKYLTGYKIPHFVEFLNEPLPKTNVGKVLRRALRAAEAARRSTRAA